MLGSAISEGITGMVVEGTMGSTGIRAGGTGAVVAEAGGMKPEAPQCALL